MTRRTIPNPSLAQQAARLKALEVPHTKAQAERLLAEAEALVGLRPAPGRPARGQRAVATKTRSLRLPESLWRSLDRAAKRQQRSANRLAAEAIARYVSEE